MLALASCAAPAVPAHDILFRGMCDASGAWVSPRGELWVADDESSEIRVFSMDGGGPVRTVDLGLGEGEADLEGAAEQSGVVYWIASHGRNKDAEPRPARQVLVAMAPDGTGVARFPGLLPALLASPDVGPVLRTAEPRAPKKGGIAIEGLAAAGDRLWIGFRSPLDANGNALVVSVELAAGGPVVGEARHLDLGGRGVRSLEYAGGSWWIVAGGAGPTGSAGLYQWDGAASPVPVPADLADLNPEALVRLPDGRLAILSDDGTRPVGGGECKSAPVAERSFRGRILKPPG